MLWRIENFIKAATIQVVEKTKFKQQFQSSLHASLEFIHAQNRIMKQFNRYVDSLFVSCN